MFSGAKKRGVVAPSEQEMVSFLADDKSKTYHRRSVPTRRSKAFSAVRRMIPTTMIPSVGAGKESDVKKRGAASQKDELRVSLIDYDGKPAAAPGDREQKADFATPWSTKHYVVLLIGSFLFTTFFFHRPVKEVVWSKHTKLLQPSETGQKRCYVSMDISNRLTVIEVILTYLIQPCSSKESRKRKRVIVGILLCQRNVPEP
jgi:hypothetical protein